MELSDTYLNIGGIKMPSLGKNINLYLMDGTAAGRWQAALSNWNGMAYKIPRDDLKNCADLPDLNTPGVYFLFGKDDETGMQFVYVGEADDVQKRLLQPHTFEKDGSYWTEAVIFVTPDGTLEKGRIKYLENRFFTMAAEAKRFLVKNGNTPPQSPMPKQIRDMLEEFILNAKLILPALGYKALEPQPSLAKKDKEEDVKLLYFSRNKGKGGQAIGKITPEGFWVLKGSYIYPHVADYTAAGIKKARKEYGTSIDKRGILQEDICFGSPSYASTFVCGKNSNGLLEWKNINGIPLKNLDSDKTEYPVLPSQKDEPGMLPMNSKEPDNEILHLAGKKVRATGKIDGDGFIVFKGSEMSQTETKSCQGYLRKLRAKLISEGKVKNGRFTEDVYFNSPSSAAGCITGSSSSGQVMWLFPDGQRLKDKLSKK
jgi:hypothetical protein